MRAQQFLALPSPFSPCSCGLQGSPEEDSNARSGEPCRTGNRIVSHLSSPVAGFRPSGAESCSPTAYRLWTAPACIGFGACVEEPVLGLRDLLRNVGLSSFRDIIEAWCENEGAAFLSDIAGNTEMDALVETLRSTPGVSSPVCQRLSHALEASTDFGNDRVAKPGIQAHQTRALLGEARQSCALLERDTGSSFSVTSPNLPCTTARSPGGRQVQKRRGCNRGFRKRWKPQPAFVAEQRRTATCRLPEQVDHCYQTRPAGTLRKTW